ncbi:unnamed protein product [Rhizophagus irregularis]|uniref:BED-type domain-containing protein n=1 Tax=Rhizophagus irregularis TaxID=588596 RepID=A0A915YN80_9GLOM|nr:unnamed protein product [Rhizophagus irregularis]
MSEDQNQEETIALRTYSKVWNHFKIVNEKAKCLHCGQKYKRNGGTTSNLHRHLQNKHPLVVTTEINNKDKNMGSLDEFANVTPHFSPSVFRNFLKKWIVNDDQPFTVVEGENFQNLFRLFRTDAVPPQQIQFNAPGQNIDFTKKHNHIRCLAHVINLVAQDALTVLKVGYFENDNEIYNQIDQNNEIGISGVIPKNDGYETDFKDAGLSMKLDFKL